MRYRLNGGVIGPVNDPNLYTAPGMWSMTDVYNGGLSMLWPGRFSIEANTNLYSIMYHNDGANTATVGTFTDSSTNNLTINRVGNASQGSASPWSVKEGYWGAAFVNRSYINSVTGSGMYAYVPNGTQFDMGTGDFTLECWINPSSLPAADTWPTNWFNHSSLIGRGTPNAGDGYNLILGATKLIFQNNDVLIASGNHNMSVARWYHVAACRSSGTLRLFVNGVTVANVAFSSSVGAGSNFYIGCETGQGAFFDGLMSNIRVTKSALYTADFTPSTTPLTKVTNTSLLTFQSNRFVDNSDNGAAVTYVNNCGATPMSPFLPDWKYTPSIHGGAAYLDGDGDNFTVDDNAVFEFGSGAFSIECWIYPTSLKGYQGILGKTGTVDQQGWVLTFETNNRVYFYAGNGSWTVAMDSGWTPPPYQWSHIVVTRDTSNVWRIFSNGILRASTTNSVTLSDYGGAFYIGKWPYFPSYSTNKDFGPGFFTGVRVVKGGMISAYNTASTTAGTKIYDVPTTPPSINDGVTAGSIVLLAGFTGAQVYDATGRSAVSPINDAKLIAGQAKFGTASMYFDGTTDYYNLLTYPGVLPNGNDLYTIEMWIKPLGYGAYTMFGFNGGGTNNLANTFRMTTTGLMNYWWGNDLSATVAGLTDGNWHHVVAQFDGTTRAIYVDGTRVASDTPGTSHNVPFATTYTIGRGYSTEDFFGYIDELVIHRYAKYSGTSYTVPTRAYDI